jgi:hypothetical protein
LYRYDEGDDQLTAEGRAKFYAALASEAKNILLGTAVTGHRPGSMLQGSPATNPAGLSTPGCQIGYMEHTGCHQLNRVLTCEITRKVRQPYNPGLRASNPILQSLQQAGGTGREPLKRWGSARWNQVDP